MRIGRAPTVLVVGDSVMLAAADRLARLGWRRVVVDAQGYRQVTRTVHVEPLGEIPSGIETIRTRTRELGPRAVVVHIGHNGKLLPEDVDAVMSEIDRSVSVLWVTLAMPQRWNHSNNDVIRSRVPRWTNGHVLDWAHLSAQQPWFAEDRIHLNHAGVHALVEEIERALDTIGVARGVAPERITAAIAVQRTRAIAGVRAAAARRRTLGAMASQGASLVHVVTADHRRGAEVVARHVVDSLATHEQAQLLVAMHDGHHRVERLGADAVLSGPTYTGGHLRATIRLRRLLRSTQPAVVIGHGGTAARVVAIAAIGTGVPVLYHRILELPPGLTRAKQLAVTAVMRRCAGVVAITGATERESVDLGYRGPVWRIPNHRPWVGFGDLDIDEARSSLRAELGLDGDAPLVGFVGHLVAQKQPTVFVEVAARVLRTNPAAHAVVAGDGALRRNVEAAAAASGVADRMHVLGHRADPGRVLAALDVAVITSVRESMTGVAIEARMAGCPVVSFPLDGLEEIVEDGVTGTLLRAPSVAEAASAAVRWLHVSDRAGVAARCRAGAERFDSDIAAAAYRRALDTIATGDDRPRVLFLLPDLGVGGLERALLVIARHAAAAGFVPAVAFLRRPRTAPEQTVLGQLQMLGVGVVRLDVPRNATRSITALARAATRLRRTQRHARFDVIDSAPIEADLVARLAFPGRRPPLLVTHLVNTAYEPDVLAVVGRAAWRARLLLLADRVASRATSGYVALTDAVRTSAIATRRVPPGDVVVIPRGVDADAFASDASDSATDEVIVSVGRLVPQKDHATVIRAMRRVTAQHPGARLVIAGDGPERAALENLVRGLGLERAVTFVGNVVDVSPLLAGASAFVLASRWEGQSNALLEAMAAGLPIAVSDVPALREVVGDAALRFPAGDDAALAACLHRLLGDRAAALALGQRAAVLVGDRYDAANMVSELGSYYRVLLGTERSRRRARTPTEQQPAGERAPDREHGVAGGGDARAAAEAS